MASVDGQAVAAANRAAAQAQAAIAAADEAQAAITAAQGATVAANQAALNAQAQANAANQAAATAKAEADAAIGAAAEAHARAVAAANGDIEAQRVGRIFFPLLFASGVSFHLSLSINPQKKNDSFSCLLFQNVKNLSTWLLGYDFRDFAFFLLSFAILAKIQFSFIFFSLRVPSMCPLFWS